MIKECKFTHNIADQLECSQNGFNSYGFAINQCHKFPCDKFKRLLQRTTANKETRE